MKKAYLLALTIAATCFIACERTVPEQTPPDNSEEKQPEKEKEEEKQEEEPVFSISPTSVEMAKEGGQFSIVVVSTAQDYEITVVEDWISTVSRRGDRKSGETIVFAAEPNEGENARTGVVSVCTENGSCIPVTVTQSGTPSLFRISATSLSFTDEGGEQTLEITASTDWTIQSTDESWLTVSPASGSADAKVTVTASPNPSKEEGRSAQLVCSYSDVTLSLDVTQDMNQEEPVFSITPTSASIGKEGGQFSIEVVSDALPYEITLVDGWISIASREGDRYTGETIVFDVQSNLYGGSRTGVVSVCTENGSCIPVMVTQEGGISTKYTRHHAAYRFTATWCGWCPYMDESFHQVDDEREDFDYVTFHASAGYPLYFEPGETLASLYRVTGFPTGVVDGWKFVSNSNTSQETAKNIIKAMDQFDESFPCLSNITFTSGVGNGSVIVDADITSSIDSDLKVVAILVESGIVETQERFGENAGTYPNFVHDHIARAVLSKDIAGDSFTAQAGKAVRFHWSVSLNSAWKKNNLSVFVAVLREYGDYSGSKSKQSFPNNYIENCRMAAVGQNVTK